MPLRTALILVTALLVAACQMAPAAAPVPAQAPAITETTLPPAGAGADLLPEPVPAPQPADIPAPAPPPDPPMLAQQRAACLRDGGSLTPRGGGLYACLHTTRDAGQRCDAASDCEGLCLARSGTCAPFTPLFGCQEVFTAPGRRETLCID